MGRRGRMVRAETGTDGMQPTRDDCQKRGHTFCLRLPSWAPRAMAGGAMRASKGDPVHRHEPATKRRQNLRRRRLKSGGRDVYELEGREDAAGPSRLLSAAHHAIPNAHRHKRIKLGHPRHNSARDNQHPIDAGLPRRGVDSTRASSPSYPSSNASYHSE